MGTPICRNVGEARREVTRLRGEIIRLTRENGLRIAAAGTHPISNWQTVPITAAARYDQIVYDLQMVARANLIFGLHVHIGVEDRETAIHMMNHARYFLPHILALSTNSPFWLGMNTGLKSYRCKVFDKFPRTNIPDYFPSWGEYENFIKLLIKTNCIDNAKKIWWDIRPHPFFNTLEFRVCDIPMRVDETIALAALIFGRWTPIGAFGAALVFGVADTLGQAVQFNPPTGDLGALLSGVPTQVFSALPYLVTIIVLAGVVGRSIPPAADGQPYEREAKAS